MLKNTYIRVIVLAICIISIFLSDSTSNAQKKKPVENVKEPVAKAISLEKSKFETAEVDTNGKVKNRRQIEVESYTEDLGNGVKLEMVKIPAGSFMMGSSKEQFEQFKKEIERYCDGCDGSKTAKTELPQHQVSVPSFYMAKFEITQAQWKSLMKINPSNFKDNDLPAENMSWNDADKFCKLLSQKTGRNYRLPTEAEWEYAARAGSTTHFPFGDTISPDIVNYDSTAPYGNAPKGDYREKTLAGGKLGIANAFGLYDMVGNVYEWCLDTWHENYEGAPTDGSAWLKGGDTTKRVLRGGAWDVNAYNCRSAYRLADFPDKRGIGPSLGFRVVAVEK
jgi:formylglycine-generating enzyme required for sulfatase activity